LPSFAPAVLSPAPGMAMRLGRGAPQKKHPRRGIRPAKKPLDRRSSSLLLSKMPDP
jgi:hypothetical protein